MDNPAPPHTPASLPHTRAMAMSEIQFLSGLGHLVPESVSEQHNMALQHAPAAPRSSNPMEEMGAPNRDRGGQDLVQRFEHLQRTVRDLAATMSAEAARHSDEGQARLRQRTIAAPGRVVIIKREEASPTTPRAFWERSCLGRFRFRTGR